MLEAALLGENQTPLARCYEAWSRHYKLQGNYPQATEKLTKAFEMAKKTLGPEHVDTARLEQDLGYLYFQQGKTDEAVNHFETALALQEKLGKDPLAQARALHNLAVA